MADGDKPMSADEATNQLLAELDEAGWHYDGIGRLQGIDPHSGELGGTDDGSDDGGDVDGGDGDDGDDAGAPGVGPGDDGAAGDDDDGLGDDGDDGDGGASPGAGAPATSFALPGGVALSTEEAAALGNLRNLLIQHPDLAARFGELVRDKFSGSTGAGGDDPGSATGQRPSEPAEPELPEFIDPDDPQAVGLWRAIQANTSQVHETEQQRAAAEARENTARIQRDIAAGVAKFRAEHPDLTDEEVETIRVYTGENVNVPGVMRNFPNDPAEGIARAMEIGSMTDPTTRDRVLANSEDRHRRRDQQKQTDSKRKQRLGALSGSTGSGTRRPAQPKKPANWTEVANQLAKELEAMGGAS